MRMDTPHLILPSCANGANKRLILGMRDRWRLRDGRWTLFRVVPVLHGARRGQWIIATNHGAGAHATGACTGQTCATAGVAGSHASCDERAGPRIAHSSAKGRVPAASGPATSSSASSSSSSRTTRKRPSLLLRRLRLAHVHDRASRMLLATWRRVRV